MECRFDDNALRKYLAGGLSAEEKADLEEHLRTCPECVRTLLRLGPVYLRKNLQNDTGYGLARNFGKYRVWSLLAAGGKGFVYRARDTRSGEVVALKILRQDVVGSQGSVRRFVREARLAMSLRHPNIIRVFDAGEMDSVLFMAMEFVDGPNLHQYVRSREPLSFQGVVNIARQVALALRAAHRQGVIHRDLKPSNVLMNKRGVAKIGDFGLARDMDSESSISRESRIIGSTYCIPPEQIVGQKADCRSDIYGLGCVLYFISTGRFPFNGERAEVLRGHLQDVPPAPHDIAPRIPAWFSDLILRCIEKDRDMRWPDTDTLLGALETPARHPDVE